MPIVGLGVLILWVGWYGFNAGSTFGTGRQLSPRSRSTRSSLRPPACSRLLAIYLKTKSMDVGMAGNGAIAGLVGITAPSGYVEFWAAPIIGPSPESSSSSASRDRQVPRRPGRRALGARSGRHLGHAAVGLFASERLILDGAARASGTASSATRPSARRPASSASRRSAWRRRSRSCSRSPTRPSAIMQATIGLRVSEEEELAGLDISSHGMYGYPESFIPQEEYPGRRVEPPAPAPAPATAAGPSAAPRHRGGAHEEGRSIHPP